MAGLANPQVRPAGNWDGAGNWNFRAAANPPQSYVEGSLYWFVANLYMERRNSPQRPPASFASLILESSFSELFPSTKEWETLHESKDWRHAHTRTGVEAAVKYAGYGTLNGFWDEETPGRWVALQPDDQPKRKSRLRFDSDEE